MMKKIVLLVFLGLALQANAWGFQAKDVINAKLQGNQGTVKVYPVTKDQAWDIAQAVLRWKKSNAVALHPEENYMLTSIGIITCPCKTEVGVWVEPVDAANTRVTIISIGRVQRNIFTNVETFPDQTGPDFHKKFEKGVEMVKSGQKLPDWLPSGK
jgi:hypothetical protein